MATIEPRLIHLLNESTTPQLPHTDLPPLHSLPLHSSVDRSLPPLDPDAIHRSDRTAGDSAQLQVAANPTSLLYIGAGPIVGPATTVDDASADYRKEVKRVDSGVGVGVGVAKQAGSSAAFPLRLLLGETDTADATYSIHKILDDGPDVADDASNKKRHRGLHVKDDFVQLPQPLKKQKAAQQVPAMPPIINGLHEPPPHAALFPPISSNSFDGKDRSHMKLLHEFNNTSPTSADIDKSASKSRKRATKPRRKWSEEETNHLLLGVDRHGVGKWTSILEDPDFRFNDRTAGDLKDRFRTCCPDELRKSGKRIQPETTPTKEIKQKPNTNAHLGKILDEPDTPSPNEEAPPSQLDGEGSAKQKKSRAHRKKMEDLAELGIHAPFKKSHRRARRPFTEQDDSEILEGLNVHGPAWTKIQRDTRFHLASRQPTDLRDRVRNKYPTIYQRIEKGTFQVKDGARSNDIMEPSINMSIDNTLKRSKTMLEPQVREGLPRWPGIENGHSTQTFEFGETSAPQFMGGEMDISRLLLDDPKLSPGSSRLAPDGSARSLSSPSGSRREHHGGHGSEARSRRLRG